jgi:hypothetical protein
LLRFKTLAVLLASVLVTAVGIANLLAATAGRPNAALPPSATWTVCLLSRGCLPSRCCESTQAKKRQQGDDNDDCADDVDESVHEDFLRMGCTSESIGPLNLPAHDKRISLGPPTPYASAHCVLVGGRCVVLAE